MDGSFNLRQYRHAHTHTQIVCPFLPRLSAELFIMYKRCTQVKRTEFLGPGSFCNLNSCVTLNWGKSLFFFLPPFSSSTDHIPNITPCLAPVRLDLGLFSYLLLSALLGVTKGDHHRVKKGPATSFAHRRGLRASVLETECQEMALL